jgi:hypothetical protein
MAHRFRISMFCLLGGMATVCLATVAIAQPTIWTGPNITFSKLGSASVALPSSQDRLTDNVWLTRASSEGMFNIAPGKELGYVRFTSPADTKWATAAMLANDGKTIAASNWADLAFADWAPAYGGPGFVLGTNITTRNAVVHLVTDDIYLDLMFTQFDSGGNYTYQRSTPGSPEPTGDYNQNGIVDGADYVVWRDTLTQTATPAAGSGADGDSSGTIDAGDYIYWRSRFGNVTAGSGGAGLSGAGAVPEPAIGIVLAGWLLLRNRRLQ